jgi:amidophosphoribosyltransferase
MSEVIASKCGVVVTSDLHDALSFGESLKHRGREACGIAAIADDRIDVVKWVGQVGDFSRSTICNILPGGDYHTFFYHNRYATRGDNRHLLRDSHPHVINPRVVDDKGNHMLMLRCEAAIVHNGQVDVERIPEVENYELKTTCDSEGLLHFFRERGEPELMRAINSGGTMAIADTKRDEVIVMRDSTGIKPGIVGRKDEYYGITSEDIAFIENGGRFIEELEPGTIYYFKRNGSSYRKRRVLSPNMKTCFFEWNYLARRESILRGVSVRSVRELLGKTLAEEFIPEDADLVTFLPESPDIAARRYADDSGIPFKEVFYKKKYERSFLGTSASDRANSIEQNLHIYTRLIPELKGSNMVIVDDSTIRGNNCRQAGVLAERAGVNKVYLLNYTPPIGVIGEDGVARGCMFGVDMPPDDNFIVRERGNGTGRNRSDEEISKLIGMGVRYISMEGMLRAYQELGVRRGNLCTYCIGGESPLLTDLSVGVTSA